MKLDIKAIETVYNGYRFRSRLEARWAKFFDSLGVKYEYEKEGYELGKSGWYLPDFWLPKQQVFVEIRPSNRYSYDAKCEELAILSGNMVLLVAGDPYLLGHRITLYDEDLIDYDPPYEFAICGRCSGLSIKSQGLNNANMVNMSCDKGCQANELAEYPINNEVNLINSYTKARQARFEHGECGR